MRNLCPIFLFIAWRDDRVSPLARRVLSPYTSFREPRFVSI